MYNVVLIVEMANKASLHTPSLLGPSRDSNELKPSEDRGHSIRRLVGVNKKKKQGN